MHRRAWISGNRAECEVNLGSRHVSGERLSEAIDIYLDSGAFDRCGPFMHLVGYMTSLPCILAPVEFTNSAAGVLLSGSM